MTWSFTLLTFRQPLITWRSIYKDGPLHPPLSHLSLSDGHPVVVHLVKTEVSVGMEGLTQCKVSICGRQWQTSTCEAFLNINWSLLRVPHHIPESRACSFGILLLRKWGRWVVIGSKMDSGGTSPAQQIISFVFLVWLVGWHLVIVLPVPFLQQSRVIAHRLQHFYQLVQLLSHDLGRNWSAVQSTRWEYRYTVRVFTCIRISDLRSK